MEQTYSYDEALAASITYFGGDEQAARLWVDKYAMKNAEGHLCEKTPTDVHRRLISRIIRLEQKLKKPATPQELFDLLDLERELSAKIQKQTGIDDDGSELAGDYLKDAVSENRAPEVVEKRPDVLDCDMVRFQNNKEKWVAFVGLLNGYPYEIFTGLQDDEEGILLPKSVTKGRILKQLNPDGTKRYDFQFENKRGYKTTVEGLSEKFNPEYWNYAKLISGVLRYRMPLDHVIRLVDQLQLNSESINTWKNGVERALKKYTSDGSEDTTMVCPNCGQETLVYQDGCLVCTNCGATK